MNEIKVSDFISGFLVKSGVKDLFLISGGGMMHLLDSAKRQDGLNLYFNLNEQASSICGESYGQFTNNLGACMVTTGPGATNAVTGCAGAWLDSTPVIYISGQCKTSQIGHLRGLRGYGMQEIGIVPVVKPITKYAVTVLEKDEICYHMEKAVYLATHGRRGPVWVDVPLDVQGAKVDTESMRHFSAAEENLEDICNISADEITTLYNMINASERPAILIGHGVVASGKAQLLRTIAEEYNIPVLATWRAKGVFGDEEALYMGSPGIPTTRYSNYVLQNTDLLIIIGTRLNPAITAFDEQHFAYAAKKIIVDIEKAEMDKLEMSFEMKFVANAGAFLEAFYAQKDKYTKKDRKRWLDYCAYIKNKYPLINEVQPVYNDGKTDGYAFAYALSERSTANDIFVGSSSGRTCGISHMAYNLKKGQSFVTSMGIGSMGWCVPSSIACCIAGGKRRTLVFEGDGSLQHNIQELALIRTYMLPIKLFVLSNDGYASIYTMQRNNFGGNLAGCNAESGLGIPNIEKIAQLYNLPYYRIENDSEINAVLDEIMSSNEPCLCEVCGSIKFDEIPKSLTKANPDGTFTSSKLEFLYPFISEEEQAKNMPAWE